MPSSSAAGRRKPLPSLAPPTANAFALALTLGAPLTPPSRGPAAAGLLRPFGGISSGGDHDGSSSTP